MPPTPGSSSFKFRKALPPKFISDQLLRNYNPTRKFHLKIISTRNKNPKLPQFPSGPSYARGFYHETISKMSLLPQKTRTAL